VIWVHQPHKTFSSTLLNLSLFFFLVVCHCSQPNVVNATLNFATNQVEVASVAQPQRPSPQQDEWTTNTHNGWTSPGQPIVTKEWHETSSLQPIPANQSTRGFHHTRQQQRQQHHAVEPLLTTSFKLNTDISSSSNTQQPVFSQVTDYTLFRDKPVVPLGDDILYPQTFVNEPEDYGGRRLMYPYVPINCIKGAYQSVDHYLATHFELMRQDSLIPLQKAVQSYRSSMQKPASTLFEDLPDPAATAATGARDFRLYERVN
jgi:hypothetical protein